MYIVKYSSTRSEMPEYYYKLKTPGLMIFLEGDRGKFPAQVEELEDYSRIERDFIYCWNDENNPGHFIKCSDEKKAHFIQCCDKACNYDPFFWKEVTAYYSQSETNVITSLGTMLARTLAIDPEYWKEEFEKTKNSQGIPDPQKMQDLTKRFRYCLDLCIYSNDKEMHDRMMHHVNKHPGIIEQFEKDVYPVVERIKQQNKIVYNKSTYTSADKKIPDMPELIKTK